MYGTPIFDYERTNLTQPFDIFYNPHFYWQMTKEPHEHWDSHCDQERRDQLSALPERFRKLVQNDREAIEAFEYVGKDLHFHWNKTCEDDRLELVFKALMNHDEDLFLEYPKVALLQFKDDLERENYDAGFEN